MSCLSDDTVAAFIERTLGPDERDAARAHIDECPACRRLVADAARAIFDTEPSNHAPGQIPPGTRIGRYVVLQRLGGGSMGVVYAAHDAELDRKVALKLLRPEIGRGEELRKRLQREAQAMARLNHPQVISVYDVGSTGDGLFVAMELVAGPTLASWLHSTPRTRAQILEQFLRAGEGLAAAHEAGLVHRDFKPDNVLIGDDGRLRVTDFGLACATDAPPPAGPLASPVTAALALSLTGEGSILGTPAYMAPEQMRGEAVDARADVFSYCCALYEALYRERPFAGDGLEALRAEVAADRVRPPPRGSSVPAWLRRALLCGLRNDPAARHATLRPLLDEIRRRTGPRRGRVLAALGVTLMLASGAFALAWVQRSRAALCHDGADRLAAVWNPERRARLSSAFAATGLRYAARITESVSRELDDYARRWALAHDEACAETRVRKQQSPERMELRFGCLDGRKRQLAALIDLFAGADTAMVDHATEAVGALERIEPCADGKALAARVPPPSDPAQRARVDALWARLAEVRALDNAGRYELAAAQARALLSEARVTGYAPLIADVLYVSGTLQARLGNTAEARALLEEAAAAAIAGGDDEEAGSAWTALIYVVGIMQDKPEEALRFGRLAAAMLERTTDERNITNVDDMLGQVQMRLGQLDEAERSGRRAVARAAKVDDESWQVKRGVNLAIILTLEGRLEEALTLCKRALEVQERNLGADHSDTCTARENYAEILVTLRRFDEARPLLKRGLEDYRRIYGPKHPRTANALMNLAEADEGQRRFAESVARNREALAILEPLLDPNDDSLSEPLTTLGLAALESGHPTDALPPLERAAAIFDHQHASSIAAAATRFALARALAAAHKDASRARNLALTAREIWSQAARRWGGVNAARAAEVDDWLKSM
jgi:serine/threonine protein kinase